jgi:hypothetical protein
METQEMDYSRMTIIAGYCGLVPYTDRFGKVKEGVYTIEGLNAPVDLSACAEDEKSILKTALRQLSEIVDESYHMGIERDY